MHSCAQLTFLPEALQCQVSCCTTTVPGVSVRISTPYDKTPSLKAAWEKVMIRLTLPQHSPLGKARAGAQRGQEPGGRQELMQKQWPITACWLPPHGLLSLITYRTQDHLPRDGTTHGGLDPPPLLLKKKLLHRLAYSLILVSQLRFPQMTPAVSN